MIKLFGSASFSSTAGLAIRAVVNPNVGPPVLELDNEILSGDDISAEVGARVLSHKAGVNPNGEDQVLVLVNEMLSGDVISFEVGARVLSHPG